MKPSSDSQDKLVSAINDFYNKPGDFNDTVREIRRIYMELLNSNTDFSFLRTKTNQNARTIRGKLWMIFLSLGKFEWTEVDDIPAPKLSLLRNKIDNEINRLNQNAKKGHDTYLTDDMIDEYKEWLTMLSLWYHKKGASDIFDQNVYVFGLLFLRNLNFVDSYQAIINFFDHAACYYVNNSRGALSKLSDYVPEVLKDIDQELYTHMIDKKEYGYYPIIKCFPTIASMFTQMRPTDQIEILWDFLIIYGIHFIVYIEAAWVMKNRDVYGTQNIADPTIFSMTNAKELLVSTVDIYKKSMETNSDLEEKICKIVYG